MGLSTFHDQAANTKQRNQDGILTNTPSGTFRYEPPEMDRDRASGKPRSRQYDIWSMGCIMIELLVWLLYSYKAVENFRLHVSQFWERTSATSYYISPYVSACLDSMENHLGEGNVYRSLLDLVRRRVLIVSVSDEYRSSPSHREIASKLHERMMEIHQEQETSCYKLTSSLEYPQNDIEQRELSYFRPHSEGGKLTVAAPEVTPLTSINTQSRPMTATTGSADIKITVRSPTMPTGPHLGIPKQTNKQEVSRATHFFSEIGINLPDQVR